jgi:hypothetical protein
LEDDVKDFMLTMSNAKTFAKIIFVIVKCDHLSFGLQYMQIGYNLIQTFYTTKERSTLLGRLMHVCGQSKDHHVHNYPINKWWSFCYQMNVRNVIRQDEDGWLVE